MHLSKIQATGLKGGEPIDYELAPITAFVGPNTVGKSRIAEAIELCVYGHVAKLGNKPNLTMQLASGDEMIVAGEYEYEKGGKTWKGGAVQTWRAGTPKYEGKTIVNNPPIMANPGVFWSMTGPQRSAYLASISDLEKLGFTAGAVFAAIESAQADSPAHAKIRHELLQEAKEAEFSASAALGQKLQEWSSKFLADITARESAAAKAYKALANAPAPQKALFADDVPSDIEAQLKAAREKLATLKVSDGVLESEAKRITAELQKIERAKNKPDAPKGDPDKLLTEINKLRAQLATMAPEAELRSALSKATMANASRTAEHTLAKNKHETTIRELNDARKMLAEFKEDATCHECHQPIPKADIAARKKELTACAKALKEAVETCENAIAKAATAESDSAAALKTANGKSAGRQNLSAEILALETQRNAILSAKTSENLGDETQLNERLDEITVKVETAAVDCYAAQEHVNRLEALHAKKQERLNDAKRSQEAQERLWDAKAKAETLKAVRDSLREEIDAINEKVWESLVKKARRFTDGMRLDEKSESAEMVFDFHEGEIGWWRGEKFVTSATMSGAQKLIAFLGIQMALCETAELKIIIIDELSGPLDDVRCALFIKRLHELIVAGHIHQVVLFDWNPRYLRIQNDMLRGKEIFSIVEVK